MPPNDSGITLTLDQCQKIQIKELLDTAKHELKKALIQSQISALNAEIKLVESQTGFNGKRLWFSCPTCSTRVGTLYTHPITHYIGCRKCIGLKYSSQRYKGMIEAKQN